MASKIDTIVATMVTQIDALSGLTCRKGPADATNHPFCQVFVERYGIDDTTSWLGLVMKYYRVSIWVEAKASEVSDTIQTLVTHWESGTDYIALQALGMGLYTINPLESDEPIVYTGDMGLGKQDFILAVRYP